MKYFLALYNDQGFCICETKDYPNDILESGNVIVSFGKNYIEFFKFSQSNNNDINNNNNIINKLEKLYEIPINNNNNSNNENTNINKDDNPYQILCVELYKQFIICGHKNGYLTTWVPVQDTYMNKEGELKVSDSAINKITTITFANKEYLILCCSDKTVKLLSLASSSVENISAQFEDEVMDIKIVKNLDNQDLLLISLKNGLIKILNVNLISLFDIPSRFGVVNTRQIISLNNPEKTPDKGDFILITEGNRIDVFNWVKQNSFKTPNNIQNQHQQSHGFNPHHSSQVPHWQFHFGKHFPYGAK